MNKSDLIEQGRKEALQNISEKIKDCFNIDIDASNQDSFIKKLILLLIEKPCLLKYHKITCSLNQVSVFHSDLSKFISQFESGFITQKKLKLGKIHFDLNLIQSESLPTKTQLSDQILTSLAESSPSLKNPENLNFFPLIETFKELQVDTSDFLIEKVKPSESLEFSDFFQESHKLKHQNLSTFDIILLKFQKKQEMILQKIEWEKQALINERFLVEAKKKKLKSKKEKLEEFAEKLKKEKVEIFKEREEIESFKISRSLGSTNPSSENSSLGSDSSPKVVSTKVLTSIQSEHKLQTKPFFPSIVPEIQKSLEHVMALLDQGNSNLIRDHLFKIRSRLALFGSNSIHSRLSLESFSQRFQEPKTLALFASTFKQKPFEVSPRSNPGPWC